MVIKMTSAQQGQATAETLLKEINPPEMGHSDKDDELIDPPTRDKLCFIIKKGEDFAKVELNLLAKNEEAKKLKKNAICVASGFIGSKSFFDIDHVFPFSKIREKQVALLKHLNENSTFAGGFLAESAKSSKLAKEMKKYFGRCFKTNKIMGKWRFFRACYNDQGNLMLLVAALNSSKNAKTPEEWIKSQKMLGTECAKAIKDKGGVNEGVILQKVFVKKGIKYVKLGDTTVYLHEGKGGGVGAFINKWCLANRQEYIELCKEVQTDFFEEIARLTDKMLQEPKYKSQVGKIKVTMSATLLPLKSFCDINEEKGAKPKKEGSLSSSDKGSESEKRGMTQLMATVWVRGYIHKMKRIRRAIESDPNVTAKDGRHLYQVFDSLHIMELSVSDRSNFFSLLAENLKLSSSPAKKHLDLPATEIEKYMKEAEEKSNSAKRAVEQTKRAVEQTKRAVEQTKRAVEQTKRAEQERERAGRLELLLLSKGIDPTQADKLKVITKKRLRSESAKKTGKKARKEKPKF